MRLKSFNSLFSSIIVASSVMWTHPSFAKKQFIVKAEVDEYRQACAPTQDLLAALSDEPEAAEFVRLWQETSTSRYTSFGDADARIFCHVVFAPKNELLRGIVVTEANKDALAVLLRRHIIGGTILEASDFSSNPMRVRSWSGDLLDLDLVNGQRRVNGSAIVGGNLSPTSHAVLIVDRLIPHIPESALDAIDDWRPIYTSGVTPVGQNVAPIFYPVLANVTGRPGLSYREISERCDFASKLAAADGVTILLTRSIRYTAVPVLRDLFTSDAELVCRAFRSNILQGRYTYSDLRAIAVVNGSVDTIDGRTAAVKISFPDSRFEYLQVGDVEANALRGPAISGGTGETVYERHGTGYTILESADFVLVE